MNNQLESEVSEHLRRLHSISDNDSAELKKSRCSLNDSRARLLALQADFRAAFASGDTIGASAIQGEIKAATAQVQAAKVEVLRLRIPVLELKVSFYCDLLSLNSDDLKESRRELAQLL